MFNSEIKETVYVAISLILAAAVLGLISFVLDIRGDFALVQNHEISTKVEMTHYAKYAKYQDNVLYGEDVMALIRECAGTDIAVYIDSLQCKTGVVKNIYLDKEEYALNPDNYTIKALEFGKDASNNNILQGGVSRDATYFVYLVFGKYTKNEIKSSKYIEEGAVDLYGNPVYVNYSDVTGIIVKFIKAERVHRSAIESTIQSIKRG